MPFRTLVIADDSTLQRLLSHTMSGEGHEVLVATNASEGLRRFSVDRPDLVIVDATVKGSDTVDVVEGLRLAESAGAHTAIILLGTTESAARVKGLRSGADDYLAKPIHPAELLARSRRLLSRFSQKPAAAAAGPLRGEVHAYYGAKGGVGTTTVSINTAIALHRELRRRVVLVDANLQFGDHRVFLDLGPERYSIVDAVTAPSIDAELLRNLVVHHGSGVDLLLAPPNPAAAEHVSAERHHLAQIVETLRTLYDYVIVDVDKRLDDHSLDVIGASDRLFVVMTADLSCLKNVRLVLHTMEQIGTPDDKVKLLLNRSNAFTGISVKSIEGVLERPVDYQIVNDYRAAISALNSGDPFMVHRTDSLIGKSLLEFVRAVDRQQAPAPRPAPSRKMIPALT
jgi:pilus assembly protein CpaE